MHTADTPEASPRDLTPTGQAHYDAGLLDAATGLPPLSDRRTYRLGYEDGAR